MNFGSILSVVALGFVCGVVARVVTPGDVFRHMSGPRSWLLSVGLGLLGALVGYLIFKVLFGIGDKNIFDWGGIVGAFIGTVIVVLVGSWIVRRANANKPVTGGASTDAAGGPPSPPAV